MSLAPDRDHSELAALVRPPEVTRPDVPSACRALAQELAALPWRLAVHAAKWPGHGPGCPCTRDLIRRVSQQAGALRETGPDGAEAVARLRHVLDCALPEEP